MFYIPGWSIYMVNISDVKWGLLEQKSSKKQVMLNQNRPF